MIAVPVARKIVALTGALNVTEKRSSGSSKLSPTMVTPIVPVRFCTDAVLAGMINVPELGM
jgi:hypothetical protein